jgi:hypothetical protein
MADKFLNLFIILSEKFLYEYFLDKNKALIIGI